MTSGPDTRLLAALRQIADALTRRQVSWALVGGLAVSVRSEPRFTRDIDLAVAAVSDDAAESLVSDLVASGFRLQLSLEQEALARLAAVRLLPHGEAESGVVIDLLFASSGIETDICREAERLEISPGLTVPVARAGHLLAMKMLSAAPDRPQDAADAQALLRGLGETERARARAAVERIEELQANRGKPLSIELERLLRSG